MTTMQASNAPQVGFSGQPFRVNRRDDQPSKNEGTDQGHIDAVDDEVEVAGYLMGTCGPAQGVVVSLSEGTYVIGRGAYANVYIQDDRVSREHTLVLVGSNSVMMIDLHAGNGTRVNNARITKAVLREGDRIEIGNSNFVFTRERPTETPPSQQG